MPDHTPVPEPEYWIMHFDGSKQIQGSGAGEELSYVLQIHFATTNNVAEYEALLHGLRMAKEIGISRIQCFGDSDLVAQQVSGTWDTKDPNMAAYRAAVDEMAKCFVGYEVKHIPRAENMAADALSRLGSARKAIPPGVFLEQLHVPSVKGADPENPEKVDSPVNAVMVDKPEWTKPYLDYLLSGIVPDDEVEQR